jgi:hypothetical protein
MMPSMNPFAADGSGGAGGVGGGGGGGLPNLQSLLAQFSAPQRVGTPPMMMGGLPAALPAVGLCTLNQVDP